ncbi:RidA family protein [Aliiglaciecola sp. CAU 1673]|uniref:RidA family protein n=1 Tax=Aliiglaciecola sp. CAU 1673 TaxID=3032595 RepID=UPI0023DA467A|nr:RidA family protein [Aliiglaciecola sp. CAU 1673]MDF2178627.1 RidA family protein [Aliiglaciecola sp. CAU 1673]
MNITRINPGKRMSDVCIHNRTAYWVEIPDDLSLDMAGQTQNLLALAEQTLKQLGLDKTALISTTIYVSDLSKLDDMNQAWEDWLEPGQAPVRACVKAELVDPEMLVEMAFIAAVPMAL